MELGLEDKVAIVTAAAGGGIGQALALGLSKEGVNVVFTDSHARRVEEAAERARAFNPNAMAIKVDVTSLEDVNHMVEETLKTFGRIDILVNNAGAATRQEVVNMTQEAWDQSINVNLRGTFYCCRAVLPTMIKQKSGNIVNFGSQVGWWGDVEFAHYSAAKAGVMTFTKSLAREVAQYNIRVNAVAPGFIWNPFLDRVESQERMEELVRRTPLGRRGEPEDLVGPVIFLASDASRWITGETICVSGGLYMPA